MSDSFISLKNFMDPPYGRNARIFSKITHYYWDENSIFKELIIYQEQILESLEYSDFILERAAQEAKERKLEYFLKMPADMRPLVVYIDANVQLEPSDKIAYFDKLGVLERCGMILLLKSDSVMSEINTPGKPIPRTTDYQIFSISPESDTSEEKDFNDFVERCRGNSMRKNVEKDLRHVWNACRYGSNYFLTWDEKFLKMEPKIRELKGVILEKPDAFVRKFFVNCQ